MEEDRKFVFFFVHFFPVFPFFVFVAVLCGSLLSAGIVPCKERRRRSLRQMAWSAWMMWPVILRGLQRGAPRLRWCRTGPARAAPGDWRPPRGRWRWCLQRERWRCEGCSGHTNWYETSDFRSKVSSPVPKPSMPGMSSPKLQRKSRLNTRTLHRFWTSGGYNCERSDPYPWIPFFGGLLLNWRVCLCLNLGGPLRGVAGPPLTRVADLISALGGSRFMVRGYGSETGLWRAVVVVISSVYGTEDKKEQNRCENWSRAEKEHFHSFLFPVNPVSVLPKTRCLTIMLMLCSGSASVTSVWHYRL